MIVGHIHNNIDALFERWSVLLNKENFPTIPALMKSFMDVESIPTIPHLIEEVPDFKSFIDGVILDKDEVLVDHTKSQQVKFYLDIVECLRMKYKLFCTDVEWLGEGGAGIKIWKEDAHGHSLWQPWRAIACSTTDNEGCGGHRERNIRICEVLGGFVRC